MLEDHTQFVNDVSIMFIDKTDPTDPLKRERKVTYYMIKLMIFSSIPEEIV